MKKSDVLEFQEEWSTIAYNISNTLTEQNRLDLRTSVQEFNEMFSLGLQLFIKSYSLSYLKEDTIDRWWKLELALDTLSVNLREADISTSRNLGKIKAKSTRIRKEMQLLWDRLDILYAYLADKGDEYVKALKIRVPREFIKVQGVPLFFIGDMPFDLRHRIVNEFIPYYVSRLNEYFPNLIKFQVPFHIYGLDVLPRSSDATSGEYKYTHINIYDYFIRHKYTKEKFCMLLVHEMGHHYFKRVLREDAKAEWVQTIRDAEIDLDLETLEAEFKGDYKEMYNNPILYLQSQSLNWTPYLDIRLQNIWSIPRAIDAYREGKIGRYVRVPAFPITGYANQNQEEAFCEALGLLIAYGHKTILNEIWILLDRILAGAITRRRLNPKK